MTTPQPPTLTPTPRVYPFECENCGHKPTAQTVLVHHGDCEKCRDTVITYTVDSAKCIDQLEREVDVLKSKLQEFCGVDNYLLSTEVDKLKEQLRQRDAELKAANEDAQRGWRWADNENGMDDNFEKDLAYHRARTGGKL